MKEAKFFRYLDLLREEFKPQPILSSFIAGFFLAMIEIFFTLSFASLIFTGPLAEHLPLGASLTLLTAAIAYISAAFLSTRPGMISTIEDITTVLFAAMAASLAATVSGPALLPTVLSALAFSTVLTGIMLIVLGQLRLGGLVRYIPYPVIGGFLAATGWMLAVGAFSTMLDTPLTLATLPRMFTSDRWIYWLPGTLIAIILLLASRRINHPLALPGALAGSFILYRVFLALAGISQTQAAAMGLYNTQNVRLNMHLMTPAILAGADWPAIFGQYQNIALLMGMTLIALLLNVSGMEFIVKRELDLNHELRGQGISNLVSGLLGGMIGYYALSITNIARRMGARGRLGGLFAGIFCIGLILSGLPLLHYIPKAVIGGALLFTGLDFLYDWVFTGWSRFNPIEYAILLMILAVIVLTDFLTGVMVGLLAMVVMFVVSYSRTRPILRSYTIADVHSTHFRSVEQNRSIARFGECSYILELQGFLFFGTANALLEQVKLRLGNPNQLQTEHLLIDFHHITGIDSSAALIFQKIFALAQEKQVNVVLAGVSPTLVKRLRLKGNDQRRSAEQPHLLILQPDLDHGIEWCEEQVLACHAPETSYQPADWREYLEKAGFSDTDLARMESYIELIEIPAGETFLHKGEPADDFSIILSGQVSIYREGTTGPGLAPVFERARTLGQGSTIGEIGLFFSSIRTANVCTDLPTQVLRLKRKAFEQMKTEAPDLAIAFHQMIIAHLADRVVQGDRSIQALW
jgi:SulP family sulfate permease